MSQVQCHTRILLIFLFENMVKVQNFLHTFCWLIKSAVFCICHFIPRMFCFFYATLLLLFPLWQLRSCWAECLGSACSTRFKVESGRRTVWTNPIIRVFRFLVLQLEGKANPTVKCVGRVKSINFLKS